MACRAPLRRLASLKMCLQPEIATARQSGSVLTCPGWKELGLGLG